MVRITLSEVMIGFVAGGRFGVENSAMTALCARGWTGVNVGN